MCHDHACIYMYMYNACVHYLQSVQVVNVCICLYVYVQYCSTVIYFTYCVQCINEARDILDTELSALVGESYSRAYGVMVSIQLLSELEEIILCLTAPDRKQQLQKTWWNRLLVG